MDFAAGTAILQSSMMPAPMMTTAVSQAALAWAVVLYSLGAILVVTGILGVSSAGMRRMRGIGSLMLLYGIVMIGVGALMFGGYAPTMGNLVLSSAGMLVVGVLMILNGGMMCRSSPMPMQGGAGFYSQPSPNRT